MKPIKNYPQKVNHPLPTDDRRLLDCIDTFCTSEKEHEFIEHMLEIEQHWITDVGAPIILEDENEDGIYIIHYNSTEYEIGNNDQSGNYGAFSLSELLSLYLDEYNILDKHITVLDWLRQRNYKNVTYDRTYESK